MHFSKTIGWKTSVSAQKPSQTSPQYYPDAPGSQTWLYNRITCEIFLSVTIWSTPEKAPQVIPVPAKVEDHPCVEQMRFTWQ